MVEHPGGAIEGKDDEASHGSELHCG